MRSDCSPIDAPSFGLAAGITAAALSAVCAAALAIAPDATVTLVSHLIHADLGNVVPRVTWVTFVAAAAGWGVLVAVTFSGGAALYNRLVAAGAERKAASARGFA